MTSEAYLLQLVSSYLTLLFHDALVFCWCVLVRRFVRSWPFCLNQSSYIEWYVKWVANQTYNKDREPQEAQDSTTPKAPFPLSSRVLHRTMSYAEKPNRLKHLCQNLHFHQYWTSILPELSRPKTVSQREEKGCVSAKITTPWNTLFSARIADLRPINIFTTQRRDLQNTKKRMMKKEHGHEFVLIN